MTGVTPLVTVAAKVTLEPTIEKSGCVVETTVVVAASPVVVNVMLHPPKVPISPPASSMMYNRQTPFGLIPANAPLRVEFADAAGDGAANVSSLPVLILVGLNVPVESGLVVGKVDAAASLRVKVTVPLAVVPPIIRKEDQIASSAER